MSPIRIKTTGASDYGRFIKCLIVGEAGSGKTLTSSTWPNPLYADSDGGLMSVAHKQLPYVEVKSSQDMKELLKHLQHTPAERTEIFGQPIDTVIIDTFDAWQGILVKERLRATKKDVFAIQDWGWLTETCKAVVNGYRNLQMNVVFLCHVRESEDEEEGRVRRPALQGGIREGITSYMDLALIIRSQLVTKVGEQKAEKVMERVIVSSPDKVHPWLKDRSGRLPREFPINFEDDYSRLKDAIFSGIEELPETTERELVALASQDDVADPLAEAPAPQPVDTRSNRAQAVIARGQRTRTVVEAPPPNVDAETGEIVGLLELQVQEEAPAPVPTPVEEPTPVADNPLAAPDEKEVVEKCEDCGGEVTGQEATISKIRYRIPLDRKCFDARRKSA